MKITIELVPGGLISVHYDDGIDTKTVIDTLTTASVNVLVNCLRKDMTHSEISDLCHLFGMAVEHSALALYKLDQDETPRSFSGKEAAFLKKLFES